MKVNEHNVRIIDDYKGTELEIAKGVGGVCRVGTWRFIGYAHLADLNTLNAVLFTKSPWFKVPRFRDLFRMVVMFR